MHAVTRILSLSQPKLFPWFSPVFFINLLGLHVTYTLVDKTTTYITWMEGKMGVLTHAWIKILRKSFELSCKITKILLECIGFGWVEDNCLCSSPYVMLCFVLVAKLELTTHWDFSCCWTVLPRCDLCFSLWLFKEQSGGVDKKLGEETARTFIF